MVTIFVGPNCKEFVVHKDLLCSSADYFNGAFTSNFEEAGTGKIYMLEDSSGAFQLYVDWLYRGTLPLFKTDDHLNSLFDLYFFANKIGLTSLQELTMDAIQDVTKKYSLKDELISPELLARILDNTPENSKGLKLFCVDMMVHVYLGRWIDKPYDEDTSDNETSEGKAGEEGKQNEPTIPGLPAVQLTKAEDTKKSTKIPINLKVKRKDLKYVHQLCQSQYKFFETFQLRLTHQMYMSRKSDLLYDPRSRPVAEKLNRNPCFYHCHSKLVKCHLNKGNQVADSFVPREKLNGSSTEA